MQHKAIERFANRLASSSPAEPREASGYCPFLHDG
jgi:hypothetical protein